MSSFPISLVTDLAPIWIGGSKCHWIVHQTNWGGYKKGQTHAVKVMVTTPAYLANEKRFWKT